MYAISRWSAWSCHVFQRATLPASIAIGLAVDDTIHYLVRYNREFRKDLDDQRALRDTWVERRGIHVSPQPGCH